jgi:hypothetical protein
VKINITVRDLNTVVLSAPVGNLEVNDLQAGTLNLEVSGGAQVRLNGITVDVLDSVLSGAGDIQASGTADEVKLILSGLGDFNAADLESKKAPSSSAYGWCHCASGRRTCGDNYRSRFNTVFGHPHVEQSVNGAGSVKPAESDD